jgi:hypothetical protein
MLTSPGLMPLVVLSSIGIADQPGWWPPEYIMGFKIILFSLLLFVGYRVLRLALNAALQR